MDVPSVASGTRRTRFFRVACNVLIFLFLLPLHVWALAAISFSNIPWQAVRVLVALVYTAGIAILLWKHRPFYRALLLTLPCFLVIVGWWMTIHPNPDLKYPPETANVATVAFDGDTITINNVRNFDYRTETDFDPHWETRTYDLSKLETVDISFVYWGVKDVAHTMTSFGFEGGEHVTLSIEQRRAIGKQDGLLEGIFKQFEIIYIWGDERDLIRLRTNYRKDEEVYLYRTKLTPAQARKLMTSMLERTDDLAKNPEFYNTATDNCTNGILQHIDKLLGRTVHFWQRPMRTGLFEKKGYDNAFETKGLSFDELKRISHVNERAHEAGNAEDFSARIRTHFEKP